METKNSWGSNKMFDKIDFKTKAIKRDKQGHYVILKGSIHQETITLINIYMPNTGAPKYVKKIFLDFKEEMDSNIVIVVYFNIPLSPLDKSSRQNINKKTTTLNNTLY